MSESPDSPQKGEVRVYEGVTYTFNGTSWTYVVRKYPNGVTSSLAYAGTPPKVSTRTADIQDTYDWNVLAGLAQGFLFANEVQVSS